ncbi:diguanylate cyclase [Thioalkalivibrio sp. ALE19]|uniref:GGDEF domain-containing protein n=1 Tax=Thioalkalivibrio sp. ALE19 TaxID=1266909 RepID=UPI0003FC10F5|nr:GGDEF domain-containing protein [Thioalkalivibrio sp. ALE19]
MSHQWLSKIAVLGSQARVLLDPRTHPETLQRSRVREAVWRLNLLAVLIGVLTPAWIVVDIATLPEREALQMGMARMLVAIALLSGLMVRNPRSLKEVWASVGMVVAILSAFHLYSVLTLSSIAPDEISRTIALSYTLLPLVMVALVALFPLTLPEATMTAIPGFLLTLFTLGSAPETTAIGAVLSVEERIWMLSLIGGIAIFASVVQVRYMHEIIRQLDYDELTGCLTRRAGEMMLERSTRHRIASVVIMFVDLDKFSEVNNSFGHKAGDETLRAVSESLRTTLRAGDSVVRWGGEEFLILLPGADSHGVQVVLDRISRQGLGLRPDRLPITASVGVAVYPTDGDNWRELVRNADMRMYEAKRRGGNRVIAGSGTEHSLDVDEKTPVEGELAAPDDEGSRTTEELADEQVLIREDC